MSMKDELKSKMEEILNKTKNIETSTNTQNNSQSKSSNSNNQNKSEEIKNTENPKKIEETTKINTETEIFLSKLNKDEDFKHLKEEMDKANNLIDYFLVVGVDPEIYKNDWLYKCEYEELKKKYKDKLEPSIISSFPPFEKTTIAFDDSILTHCFPNGFHIEKSNTKIKPKIFSFILDNNYFNLNYPQKYLTCLICYESLSSYKMLYDENKLLNNLKINNDFDKKFNERNYEIFIPKCLVIMSLYPYFGEFEKIITEIHNYSLGKTFYKNERSNTTLSNNSDNLSKRGTSVSIEKVPTFKSLDIEVDILIPIDKIIENLCIELPAPPRGVSTVKYYLNNEERTIKQNLMNQLPLVNINLKKLFFNFKVKDIIQIYNYLFLEQRILFFSKNIENLNYYIYGLLQFLYPFQYQYQVVTILPEINFDILESITPFIAGINQKYSKDFFSKRNYQLSDSILIVDIDRVECKPTDEESKIPEFPKNYYKTLKNDLDKLITKYLKEDFKLKEKKINKKLSKRQSIAPGKLNQMVLNRKELNKNFKEDTDLLKKSLISINEIEDEESDDEISESLNNLNIDYNFNQEVHQIFFNFNASLLLNYSNYLNRDFYSSNTMPCLEILFKVNDFLKEKPSNEKEFYNKFITETQIFGDFIYLRMIPKNSKEKIRILPFDENINEKKRGLLEKKTESVFSNSHEYDYTNKYEVQKPRNLTNSEINYYKNYKKKLINYGIIIKEDKNDSNKILFTYPIFPKLTTQIFFLDNIKEYYPPMNWNENLDSINEDLVSKSHLGNVSTRNNMKNYVYICWLQMWAMTFWYNEEKEKNYWFQELLKVIEKFGCFEMEVYNLLFETLSKNGRDSMVLKLYKKLLLKKLNPSSKVHNIVMKIVENKKMEGNFQDKLQKLIDREGNRSYNKNNFSRRTFRNRYNENILSEDVCFYAFDNCIECQKFINLEIVSKNYQAMTRDLIWTSCPECKCPLLPKITVQFGQEINKNKSMKKNTSNFEQIVLFSPYSLKNNYDTTLVKNFGIKLDVDELMWKYSKIFWGSLWYFKLNELEYDFMLPYYYRLEQIKVNRNLEVTFGDLGKKNKEEDVSEIEYVKENFNQKEFKIVKNDFVLMGKSKKK